jgi:hypothetical protein
MLTIIPWSGVLTKPAIVYSMGVSIVVELNLPEYHLQPDRKKNFHLAGRNNYIQC